jgi:hypothetical protein
MELKLSPAQKDTFESLFDAIEAKSDAEGRIMLLIARMRELDTPWSLIAETLGVTKQAAWERYGRHERASENRLTVCYICGRKGERGFTQSSGNGDGTKDAWRCSYVAACTKREAAKAKALGWD